MDIDMVFSMIYNISLLIAVSFILVSKKSVIFNPKKIILIGFIIGLVGVGIMYNTFEFSLGINVDIRSILISISGLFAGLIPTAIASIIMVLFRIYQGGMGTVAGILTIIASALIGLAWRYFRYNKLVERKRKRWLDLYILGIIVHIGVLASAHAIPWPTAITVLDNISAPVMIIYPIGTVWLGMILFRIIDNDTTSIQLEESEQRYRSMFEKNHAVMLLIDPPSGQIVDANPAACAFYGWGLAEIKKKFISEINTMPDEMVIQEMSRLLNKNKSFFRFQHRLASGEIRDVDVYSGSIVINGRKLLFSIIHDTTQRALAQKRLKESEERFRVTLLSVGDGVITTDKKGNINLINKAAEQITGYKFEDVNGKPVDTVLKLLNEDTREVQNPVGRVLETGEIVGLANHTVLVCKDRSEKPIADSAAPIKNQDGHIIGAVLVIRDATEEREYINKIDYLAYHDELTSLYNRRFFDQETMRLDVAQNLPLSVIIGDVNGLKITNDAFGHAVGDELLIKMASKINNACRHEDVVARWGGDEFIILLPKASEYVAKDICERIKLGCDDIMLSEVNFSISLGYATKQESSESIIDTIKSAEDFMYRRKSTESASSRGQTINTILHTLHEKNEREQMHSNRVSELCKKIGQAMNLSEKEIGELKLMGLMHDIGKIAINDNILNKEGKLTDKEYSEIKRHPEIGYRILSASDNMAYLAEYVLKHHERLDGKGYPGGLTGDQIPLQSRIICIADAYDAMTSERPYKTALSVEEAIAELIKCSGIQFDGDIVSIFIDKVLKQ